MAEGARRLRDTALRLAEALDEARLYTAAAYVSMAADAVDGVDRGAGRRGARRRGCG